MAEVLVVADDLTGSNATGALFARQGMRAVTVSDIRHARRHRDAADVVVVNTASRHCPAAQARALVAEVAGALGSDMRLLVKRVDTTLRGNVGAELAGMLEGLRARMPHARALCVPAFPSAGRTTVGGVHLVDGVPLTETDAARDPLSPITASRVATLLRAQTELSVGEIVLDVVQAGQEALVRAMRADRSDVLVCDAVTPGHVSVLARAAAATGETWLSVDSGPFGAALAAELGIGGTPKPILVVAGSVTARTTEQLREAGHILGARLCEVTALDEDALTADVIGLLDDGATVAGLRMVPAEFDPALAGRIPHVLAAVARNVVESGRVGGVYATGGDVSVAVVDALGAEGFEVDAEVQPLAVAGRLVGGPHAGFPFAAKGGLIGDRQAAVDCVEHLRMITIRDERTMHR
ncbi:four-carbon acid sugar kinase family protein [Actinomadura keratinilytica]|uniref:Four-carbon acid sugar kinase family protein n=1 Tax=Actinomadura keratinilytica TaxID=547461 RepID=A0ABP7XZQ9_9ACTN